MMNSIFNMRYHTISEGERVHYRPLEEIQFALEVGYLELEFVHGEDHWIMVIRSINGLKVVATEGQIGMKPVNVEIYRDLTHLVSDSQLDLHAFRWYPHRAGVPPKPVLAQSSEKQGIGYMPGEGSRSTNPTLPVIKPKSPSFVQATVVKLVPLTNIPYPEVLQ